MYVPITVVVAVDFMLLSLENFGSSPPYAAMVGLASAHPVTKRKKVREWKILSAILLRNSFRKQFRERSD